LELEGYLRAIMLEAYLAGGSPCWRLSLSEVAENPEKWRVIQQSSPWSSGIYPWTKETLPELLKLILELCRLILEPWRITLHCKKSKK
jgi:hypothetical protein